MRPFSQFWHHCKTQATHRTLSLLLARCIQASSQGSPRPARLGSPAWQSQYEIGGELRSDWTGTCVAVEKSRTGNAPQTMNCRPSHGQVPSQFGTTLEFGNRQHRHQIETTFRQLPIPCRILYGLFLFLRDIVHLCTNNSTQTSFTERLMIPSDSSRLAVVVAPWCDWACNTFDLCVCSSSIAILPDCVKPLFSSNCLNQDDGVTCTACHWNAFGSHICCRTHLRWWTSRIWAAASGAALNSSRP